MSILNLFRRKNTSLLSFVRSTNLSSSTYISPFSRISGSNFGEFSSVGWFCIIDNVDIGHSVSVASHCVLGAPNHLFSQPCQRLSRRYLSKFSGSKALRTSIGPDSWIGAHSIVAEGINIGCGCIVGANSFVNKDLPDYSIAAGSPATILRLRFGPEKIHALIDTKPWLWSDEVLVNFYDAFGSEWSVDDLLNFDIKHED
jgi:acetyltransferase-like isoleucine patch superfamily enzyme